MTEKTLFNASSSVVDWTKSDQYQNSFLIPKDEVLEFTRENSVAQGLPAAIAVSAAQGKFLNLLAQSISAKRILEVGTLGGYSSIWMGRALPEDGLLLTLEMDETHAKCARENLAKAGLQDRCKVIVGPAHDSMNGLHPEVPFDLIFIDADSAEDLKYFTEAKRLVKKGGVIIVDNMVRKGRTHDLSFNDASSIGIRELLTALKEDKEIEATTISTVGEKSWDGFLYAVRK